jgi:sporulation protein YlmC with PRC-barrel domain
MLTLGIHTQTHKVLFSISFLTFFLTILIAFPFQKITAQSANSLSPYDLTIPLNNGFYQVKKGKLWTIVDSTGAKLEQWDWFSTIGTVKDGLVLVEKDKKMGFTDPSGRIVINPKYDRAYDFNQGLTKACIKNKCDWIDTSGQITLVGDEDEAESPLMQFNKYGLRVVSKWVKKKAFDKGDVKNGRLPSINLNKSKTIVLLGSAKDKEDAYRADKEQLFGLMDRSGKLILPIEYQSISRFYKGFASVVKEFKAGIIDASGRFVLEPQYQEVTVLDNGYALLKDIQYVGLADISGTVMIKPNKYNSLSFTPDGLFLNACEGSRCGIVDLQGKEIIPVKYQRIGNVSEGMVKIGKLKGFALGNQSDANWGWLDQTGKEVIPIQYEDVKDFREGLAPFKILKKGWGLINKEGKVILEPTYENLHSLQEGRALAKLQGKWGWIDKEGKNLIPFIYNDADNFHGDLAPVKGQKKWGLADKKGNLVVPYMYDRIKPIYLEDGSLIFEATIFDEMTIDLNQKGEKIFK